MNTIKRDVYVLKNTIKIPIEVTKGTDAISFEFTVRDYNLPATAAAVAYAYRMGMKRPNSTLCDVSGNVISFQPSANFFEVGNNELQIRVINEDKSLISFKEKVKCSDSMGFPDEEEEADKSLIEQIIAQSGKESGERKAADEKERSERKTADETEKSERIAADAKEKSERQKEIATERARIDRLTKMGEGSTTGDAELADIRVGNEGATYSNAGNAVRAQTKDVPVMMDNLQSPYVDISLLEQGSINSAVGSEIASSKVLRSVEFHWNKNGKITAPAGYKIAIANYAMQPEESGQMTKVYMSFENYSDSQTSSKADGDAESRRLLIKRSDGADINAEDLRGKITTNVPGLRAMDVIENLEEKIKTDTTLEKEGVAADAAETGKRISQAKEDINLLKEDLSNEKQLSLIHNQFDNVGLKNLYTAGDMESEYTGGTYKWIGKKVELPVGTYTLAVKDMKRNDNHPLYIEATTNGTIFGNLRSAGYVVFNVTDAKDYDGTVQIRLQISDAKDNEAGAYFARGISIYAGDVSNKLLTTTEIATEIATKIATEKLSKVRGKNLFDKNSSDIVRGVFVSNLGTNIENKYSSVYYATGYIAIEANTIYALTDYDLGGAYIAFYDKFSRIISSLQGTKDLSVSKGIFTSPENAKYVRLTGNISKIDTNQLEKGNKITTYVDYSEYVPFTKLEKEVEKVKETLSGMGVNGCTTTGITGNASTLSDGEKIELESSNVKYNKHLSFFAHVTSFSGLTVGRTPTGWGASYAVIDVTNITIYWYGRSATQKAQVAHGLTIKDYISVTIDVGVDVATITLRTNGGTYILKDTSWDGANGTIHAQSNGSALTDCSLSWFADSWKYDVWAFGDSYFDFYPKLIIKDGHDKWMVDMYSGRGAYAALTSFKRNLKHGRPKFALWCMGMNDVDSDIAINSKWETSTTEFISLCEQYGITPILSTIPNARGGKVEDTDIYNTRINTFKNTWIKASGHRYVDLCNAVGAETNYNWYDGMLNTGDGVHPATQGVQAIIARIYADFPEILECS